MIALEFSCVAIVLLYVVVRARIDPKPMAFLLRLVVLMAASWVGENSVIHAYHFYAYSPRWSVFVDQVPLLVVTIWPVVIHSAWDLAKRLSNQRTPKGSGHEPLQPIPSLPNPMRVVLVASLLVLGDASLIEPIAVKAGLWSWSEPGLFEVPPIGIIGWALFASGCFFVFEHRRLADPLTILLAPAMAHPMLLALWWGALRWVNGEISPWPVVVIAWILSLSLAALAYRRRWGEAVPRRDLFLRIPGAGFFFVLLAIHARDEPALIAYALAFAPPYLVLSAHAPRSAD